MSKVEPPTKMRRIALGAAGVLVAAGLTMIARRAMRLPTRALDRDGPYLIRAASSGLADRIAGLADPNPGRSGIHLLADPHDAFAARILLARHAERTLNVQYYIWTRDRSGMMLFKEVIDAAERGVRIRLLLDDHGTSGLDDTLSALAAHPNISVRLFNPFPWRFAKIAAFAFDFTRLNRRMHNKSFIADGAAAIVGGRNIGDTYFGASDGALLADLDLVVIGSVVGDIERSFDDYWSSALALPIGQLVGKRPPFILDLIRREAEQVLNEEASAAYRDAIERLPIIRQIADGSIALDWTIARLVADPASKSEGRTPSRGSLATRLNRAIGDPQAALTLVSAYFVPGHAMVKELTRLARSGVEVRVVTNGASATDVGLVFAYYSKYRLPLVTGGVRLFEFRRDPSFDQPKALTWRKTAEAFVPHAGSRSSGASSLHAKTFTIDGQHLYVGSFNLDPRSFELNTELGLIIDSPTLVAEVERQLDGGLPASAYEVVSTPHGLGWIDRREAGDPILAAEPGMTRATRLAARVLERLPLEWLT